MLRPWAGLGLWLRVATRRALGRWEVGGDPQSGLWKVEVKCRRSAEPKPRGPQVGLEGEPEFPPPVTELGDPQSFGAGPHRPLRLY